MAEHVLAQVGDDALANVVTRKKRSARQREHRHDADHYAK